MSEESESQLTEQEEALKEEETKVVQEEQKELKKPPPDEATSESESISQKNSQENEANSDSSTSAAVAASASTSASASASEPEKKSNTSKAAADSASTSASASASTSASASKTEKKSEIEGNSEKAAAIESKTENVVETAGGEQPAVQGQVKADSTSTQQDYAGYEQHVTYEDGVAIYTDPSTKQKYKWCSTQNNWQPVNADGASTERNLYENEHYKWCHETKQWLPKETNATNTTVTETEHYKWDAEQKKWLLKQQPTKTKNAAGEDVVYGVDENGDRIYTDKDGVVFIWDAKKSAWFPKIDDVFMALYQMNYGFIDNTSAGEREKAEREAAEQKRKDEELKRMTAEARAAMAAQSDDKDGAGAALGKRKAPEPPKWFEIDPSQNTKVYVSNLPLDIDMEEFAELMSKCGLIMRDPQTLRYKLKLYTEPDGQLKGDGLCDYIKVESVNLAVHILDEYDLRGHKIRVQRAEFQMRGEYNPSLKPKRKKKEKERLQKIKQKLLDWRPDKMRGERSKNEKTVIIKNLFAPELFEQQVELILEYQNNLREECAKCGIVRKVVICDRHPEGVVQIMMSTPEEADEVIQMMQGRYFGQRQLTAEHWDGKTKYKIDESATEAQERLSKWDDFLAAEEAAEAADAAEEAEEAATDAAAVTPTGSPEAAEETD